MKYQYTYIAYGLTIGSQFPIFGLTKSNSDNPDVVIENGRTPDQLPNVKNQTRFYQSNDEQFLLKIRNIATYYVTQGINVIVQPELKANVEEISAYLGGLVMGAIFHQRGLLPLHASSVVYKEKCLIFAGDAGSGKSTLAALFIKSGAKLVSDDISLIGFFNNLPVIFPASPYIKAWKQNLIKLGYNEKNLLKVPLEKDKYYLPILEFVAKATFIDHIFFIEPNKVVSTEAIRLLGIQKFVRFKKYGYLGNSINNTAHEKVHFEMLNKLTNTVPASSLLRPESEFNVDQLMAAALSHMEYADKRDPSLSSC